MTITVLSCMEDGKFYFAGLYQDIMIYRVDSDCIELIETSGFWIGLLDESRDLFTVPFSNSSNFSS